MGIKLGFSLRDELRLWVTENRVLRRIFGIMKKKVSDRKLENMVQGGAS
jgi:hypothetical protein